MDHHEKPIKGKNPSISPTDAARRHQSLLATRMRTEDMIPIATCSTSRLLVAGGVGRRHLRRLMRFLNEDPWERLRVLKAAMPNTRLQMLLRGQNVVGYRHYADDVVEEFVAWRSRTASTSSASSTPSTTSATWRRHAGGQKYAGIGAGHDLLHHEPRAQHRGFVKTPHELLQWARRAMHQGHGGPAHPTDAYDLVSGSRPTPTSSRTCTPTTPAAWPPWRTSRRRKPAWTSWTAPSRRCPWAPRNPRRRPWWRSWPAPPRHGHGPGAAQRSPTTSG